MARTPKRLYGPVVGATAAATSYTVPASTKTIVRHIHVEAPVGATATFSIAIGTAGSTGAANRIFNAQAITANSTLDHWCYYVLEATETITTIASSNETGSVGLIFVANGEEITLG